MIKYIIGIDEVGRGPLAGPVAVGVFCVTVENHKKLRKLFPSARDSKKLTVQRRKEIFKQVTVQQKNGAVRYAVQYESARGIDARGLSWAIRSCVSKCLKKLAVNPAQVMVLLDGGLKASAEYIHQKTIIRGDDSELVISLASICAKVTRDAHMQKLAKRYPAYGFEVHKGYGTARHRQAIQTHGISPEHRVSFLRNICL